MTADAYALLKDRFARLAKLDEAMEMLAWDASVNMPTGGAKDRAEQTATLAALHHELLTAPEVGDWLDEADAAALADDMWDRANLHEMRRAYAHAAAVPGDLVEALTHASSDCEMAWRKARPAGDFAAVAPLLETLLGLVRQKAEAVGEALGVSPYNALLDTFEPGGTIEAIEPVFADLEKALPDLLTEVLAKQARDPSVLMPEGPFPVDKQKALGEKFMHAVGFDFDHGRLDISAHPFSSGTRDDSRITTRYDEDDFTSSLMGVLHETGHAMYERGLPRGDWRYQPVGRARGMSLHESQSLLIEMQACRSPAFLSWAVPIMAVAFGGEGETWEAANLRRLYTRVAPGFIRVDADEVTYPAHVILRTKLETALISGDLAVADLPGAWNEGMHKLLGITPPSDREGCLQDIHWYDGAFGYFPTYTLGAMTAAQLFAAAKASDPAIYESLADGHFAPLMAWLRENVHGKGSLLSSTQLLEQATGKPLDAEVFMTHLRHRYLEDGE